MSQCLCFPMIWNPSCFTNILTWPNDTCFKNLSPASVCILSISYLTVITWHLFFLYLATPTNAPSSSADWVVISLPTLLPSWENTDWVRVCTQLRHNLCYINQSSDVEQIYFQLNYKFIFSEIWQTGSEHTRKIRPGVLKAEGFSLVIIRMIRRLQ